MTTELQKLYLEARVKSRLRHGAALRLIARRTGLDTATIARCLHRARRDDEREAKRTSDSVRYSALGDAVTVNVAEWLGRRMREEQQLGS